MASIQKSSFPFKACLLAAAVLFLYSFSMGGDFKTDDRFSILLNPLVRDWTRILEFFQQGYFGDQSYYRPFVYLTYTAEYHLFGGVSFFYSLNNALIHIGNALLVWKLADALIPERKMGFWIACVFAIHPIHWEAVANISGRSILLCSMFFLLSVYAFIKSFEKEQARWLAASVVCFVLALLNKESAGVLPGVLFFYAVCLRRPAVWKKLMVYLLPFAAVVVGYIFLRKFMGLDAVYGWPTLQEHWLGFISFLRSVITHLRLLIWPVGLYFDRSQAVYPSIDHPEVLYVSTFWLLVVVQGWIFRRYLNHLDWFCVAWMALELLPVSQIVAAIGVAPGYISTADHFLYTASIPFLILFFRWAGKLGEIRFVRMSVSRQSARIIAVSAAIFLAVMNIEQNLYARDEASMLERSLRYQPHNARLQNLAGYLAAENSDFRKAEEHFTWAVQMDPSSPSSRISLGKALCDQNRFGEALIQYLSIQNPGPFTKILEENIQYPVGILSAKVTSGRPVSQTDWFGWGLYRAYNGDIDGAISALEQVIRINDANISGLLTLASLYEAAGQIVRARECYLKLMDIDVLPEVFLKDVIAKLADLRIHYPEAFHTEAVLHAETASKKD